jgi:hypothetical protein
MTENNHQRPILIGGFSGVFTFLMETALLVRMWRHAARGSIAASCYRQQSS